MGTWGPGLYADDTTSEVRDEFRSWLSSGLAPSEAQARILSRYESLLTDHQVACLVLFALADVQWRLGCLSGLVKQRALALLEAGGDLQHWADESPSDVRARRRTLDALHARLLTPQAQWKPPPLRKARPRRVQVDLPTGAVLRLGLTGKRYALLKLVGSLPVGHVDTAVFRVLPWRSERSPSEPALAAISERWLLVDGHHEFSILFDGRKKLTSVLQPTGITLDSTTPIDLACWRAFGVEALVPALMSALAALDGAP